MMNRRLFLLGSLAATASACASSQETPTTPQKDPAEGGQPTQKPAPEAKKSLLVLGGTGFLGPAVVEAARARGWSITLFNRGKTRPGLFPDIEKLKGNRDPNKDEGLKALEGRTWDAVVDTSGYVPRIVSASAELLAKNVKHYIYISSISVYKDNSVPGIDESAVVGTMADPKVETMGKEFENYGPLKALCEQAAEKAMPGRVANVRPGYIVGPEDPTDRFTYWPVRAARGGEMLVPGTPDDPIQVIDVRDLGAWLVMLAANETMGVFNAVGPDAPLTMGHVLEACKKAANPTDLQYTWVSNKFMKDAPGEPIDMPIWAPFEGDTKGFHQVNGKKAIATGLKCRAIEPTVVDTLAWWKTLPEERRAKMRAGLKPEQETELLKLLKAKK
jgi:2'-hydroxyisoflavone reductase